MRDQAENLRLRLQRVNQEAKVIAVISGKGGVGKSNFSLNFSLTLAKLNKRVLLFDLDIGMGNIDILLGATSGNTIIDIFNNHHTIHDIINEETGNFSYISAGTAFSNVFKLNEDKVNYFLSQIQLIMQNYDYIIFDMGAGMTQENVNLLLSVDDIFVITTPEPTAIMDAYAAMKQVCMRRSQSDFFVMVNRIISSKEGQMTFERLYHTMSQFLKKEISLLGMLPEDKNVLKAVRAQVPFVRYNAKAKASTAICDIANRYVMKNGSYVQQSSSPFIAKLKRFFLER